MSRTGASPTAQAILAELQERYERQQKDDLRAVLSTPEGRRLVWRIVDEIAGVHGKAFHGSPEVALHAEGRRSVGIDLMLAVQTLDPTLWQQVIADRMNALREEQEHKRAAEEAAEKENADGGW